MKLSILFTLVILASTLNVDAQGLSAPDDPAQAPQPVAPTTPDTVTPKHNTPHDSFRAERNAIRHGNAQFNDSNYHKALEYYDAALRENAGSLAARYNYATTLLHLSSEDNRGTESDPRRKAAEMYQSLIQDARTLRPDIAEKAFYNLGNISYNDQDYGSAIAFYERSLVINPDNYDCRYNLRLAQLKQQQQQQNQDNQDQDENQDQDQQQQQQQQEQQQSQDNQEQNQDQQQQQQPMTQSAQQILQSMQNKENETRRRMQEIPAEGRRQQSDKPW